MLKTSAWLLHLIGDKAPPAARDSSEVARSLRQRCYPHTGSDGQSWCWSSSLSLPVGLSIQDEAMDVARSTPQGAPYHADVKYWLGRAAEIPKTWKQLPTPVWILPQ